MNAELTTSRTLSFSDIGLVIACIKINRKLEIGNQKLKRCSESNGIASMYVHQVVHEMQRGACNNKVGNGFVCAGVWV